MTDKDLYLKIGKPNNVCSGCGQEIAHTGKHPSVLRGGDAPAQAATARPAADKKSSPETQPHDGGPRREDYCAACWQAMGQQDYLGYWLARRQPPKVRKIESRKERNAGVLAWFDLLRSQDPDEENLQSQFFLAHLLMKYGVLKWSRTETDDQGNEIIYFRQTGTEDDVPVVAVDIPDDRNVEIKRQLDEFLLRYANTELAADAGAVAPTGDPDL